MKKIKAFIIRYYPQIILVVVLSIISIVSIRWGEHLISNDNYSPELNPSVTIERSLGSPAWRSYRALGFASESEQADVFRSLFLGYGDLVFPNWSLSQIFSIVSLWIGSFSIAYLTTFFVRDFVKSKFSGNIFLLSGLLYVSTLWTAWVFNFNMMPYVTQYGFLPLLLLSIYVVLKEFNVRNLLILLVTSLLFTSVCVIATLFVVNIVLVTFLFLYFGYLHRTKLKNILIPFGIFLITQLFWLLPFIQYTVSTSQDIIDSYTNRAVTANMIDLEAEMLDLTNAARFYTRLLGTVDDSQANTYLFPPSTQYTEYDFFKVVGLLPIFLSVLGLVFTIVKKKWKLLPLWVVMFGLLFLIKNQNPPLGFIYIWLQDNIPLFKQIFRWVSSKLSQPYLVLLVITASIGYMHFVDFLTHFMKSKTAKIFSLLVLLIILYPLFIYTEYLFKGELFAQRATVELPEQYNSLSKYLEKDPDARIYYAPPSNNGYFREYDWGFIGSQFLGYVIPNPIMDMSLAIGSDVGERAMLELAQDFNSKSLEDFNSDLDKYDIKYVLVDKSLIQGRYGYAIQWDVIDEFVKNWDLKWSDEFLFLYEVPQSGQEKYTEYLGVSNRLSENTFVREKPYDFSINPMFFDYTDATLKDGYITKDFEYDGNTQSVYLNKKIDLKALPSYLQKSGNIITASPLLPIINGVENNSYKNFTLNSSAGYTYLIGKNVYDEQKLADGIGVYEKWGDLNKVYVSSDSSFESINITDNLLASESTDCSGSEFKVLADVSELRKGFLIEGNTDLPCLNTKLRIDKTQNHIAKLKLKWDGRENSSIGYCLYSEKSKSCLNTERFIYPNQGNGEYEVTIPKLLEAGDKFVFSIYAFNPEGEKISLVVEDVELLLSSNFERIEVSDTQLEENVQPLVFRSGEKFNIKIPVIYGEDSYIYDHKMMWNTSLAEDSDLTFVVKYDNGMYQGVTYQFLNQYLNIFNTKANKPYLWFWEGENVSNIPASLCLTYPGDDKCWIDNSFFDNKKSSQMQFFNGSYKYNSLDASYNSISFENTTENILSEFVVMNIPDQWFEYTFSPTLVDEYTEYEANPIFNSAHTTFYKFTQQDIDNNALLSIPQARSYGWIAIKVDGVFFKVLEDRVSIGGWKQGWDISNIDSYDRISVIYWPNLLAYLGYILIPITFLLIFKSSKKKRYVKR